MTRQVEAHHFCGCNSEEMRQCLIYDSPNSDARLIGVEYIISENLFLALPDDEKPLWHSHLYEVKSGLLFMPGIPGPIERQAMDVVCKTYGKVFHFWQIDEGHSVLLGLPQLMMAFTKDGQIDQDLLQGVEQRFGVHCDTERKNREHISGPKHGIHPLANAAGKGIETVLREVDCGTPDPNTPGATRVFV